MDETVEKMLVGGDWQGLASALGFGELLALGEVGKRSWGLEMLDAHAVSVASGGPGVRLMVVWGVPEHRVGRAAMDVVHRRNPADATLWWWVGADRLWVSVVVEGSGGVVGVRRMGIARGGTEREGLRRLGGLRVGDLVWGEERERGRAVRGHFAEVMDQEAVTRAFFESFRSSLQRLKAEMVGGPLSNDERHHVSLTTLLRVLFLYFLQARGAINADSRFVLRSWRSRNRAVSFYRGSLRPLFFGVLNTPVEQRDEAARGLGEIPFLNGGLFDPTGLEAAYPDLDWPDEVWGEVLEGVLERYHFDLTADSAEESCSIDPEMLGKVFEGLMLGETRHRTGSFYTPVDVVRSMVRKGLSHHIQEHSGWALARVEGLFEETTVDLDTRDVLRGALEKLRIVDPAVGTGAFLLEALNQLKHLWTLVDGSVDHVRMRELIHQHLFGVDINVTATRLCELRLWIALLSATPDEAIGRMPPLPNLSHRIVTGDALLEPFDVVSRRRKRGTWVGSRWVRGALAREVAELQRRYLTCHGSSKARLRAELEARERAMMLEAIEGRLRRVEAEERQIRDVLEQADLFGQRVVDRGLTSNLREVVGEREALEGLRDRVRDGEASWVMSWATKFPQVFAEGGFDVVLTNPPWVRAHRVDRPTRDVLSARYQSAQPGGLWREAVQRGVKSNFGSQFDLANVFVERGLELLKPGGHLVALVPSKMFRSLQGVGIRKRLARQDVLSVEDFSESSRVMFDATTYPACVHVRQSSTDVATSIRVWNGGEVEAWEQYLPKDGSPWVLVPPEIRRILETMRRRGTANFEPSRGVFTGSNEVFIGTLERWVEALGEEVVPFLRPVMTGSDLSGQRAMILWPYDESLRPISTLPESLTRWFEGHRSSLEGRSDHDAGLPLWQVFRVRRDVCAPKVVWRDIARDLEPEVAVEGVPLNTVYYLPATSRRHAESLAALLGSVPMRAAARALTERARGGYRRHFAWCIRLLPVTRELLAEAAAGQVMSDARVAQSLGLSERDLDVLRRWLGEDACEGVAA